jgi:hypothetical protein
MTPAAGGRSPHPILLNRLAGGVLAGTWALVGLRFATANDAISVKALVAALAFAIAGVGLGVVGASFAAEHAMRRGRPVPAPGSENLGTFFALMGLVNVAWGLEPALQPTPSAWAWLPLVFSVAGGTFIGFAAIFGGRAPSQGFGVVRSSQQPPSLL